MSSTGRRRSNIRQYSAEGEALNQISKEAEDRLAAKRAARAEAREIRQREIERKMKEQEMAEGNGEAHAEVTTPKNYRDEEPEDLPVRDKDRDFKDDEYDSDLDPESDDMNEFRELEEKYKGAMMSLAQLDNERTALNYSVDLLKEDLEEREEASLELQRQLKEKTRDLDFAKRDLKDSERQLAQVKEVLSYQEKVMEESGFMIVRDEEGKMVVEKTSTMHNGPINNAVLLTSDTLGLLQKEEGTLGTATNRPTVSRATQTPSHFTQTDVPDGGESPSTATPSHSAADDGSATPADKPDQSSDLTGQRSEAAEELESSVDVPVDGVAVEVSQGLHEDSTQEGGVEALCVVTDEPDGSGGGTSSGAKATEASPLAKEKMVLEVGSEGAITREDSGISSPDATTTAVEGLSKGVSLSGSVECASDVNHTRNQPKRSGSCAGGDQHSDEEEFYDACSSPLPSPLDGHKFLDQGSSRLAEAESKPAQGAEAPKGPTGGRLDQSSVDIEGSSVDGPEFLPKEEKNLEEMLEVVEKSQPAESQKKNKKKRKKKKKKQQKEVGGKEAGQDDDGGASLKDEKHASDREGSEGSEEGLCDKPGEPEMKVVSNEATNTSSTSEIEKQETEEQEKGKATAPEESEKPLQEVDLPDTQSDQNKPTAEEGKDTTEEVVQESQENKGDLATKCQETEPDTTAEDTRREDEKVEKEDDLATTEKAAGAADTEKVQEDNTQHGDDEDHHSDADTLSEDPEKMSRKGSQKRKQEGFDRTLSAGTLPQDKKLKFDEAGQSEVTEKEEEQPQADEEPEAEAEDLPVKFEAGEEDQLEAAETEVTDTPSPDNDSTKAEDSAEAPQSSEDKEGKDTESSDGVTEVAESKVDGGGEVQSQNDTVHAEQDQASHDDKEENKEAEGDKHATEEKEDVKEDENSSKADEKLETSHADSSTKEEVHLEEQVEERTTAENQDNAASKEEDATDQQGEEKAEHPDKELTEPAMEESLEKAKENQEDVASKEDGGNDQQGEEKVEQPDEDLKKTALEENLEGDEAEETGKQMRQTSTPLQKSTSLDQSEDGGNDEYDFDDIDEVLEIPPEPGVSESSDQQDKISQLSSPSLDTLDTLDTTSTHSAISTDRLDTGSMASLLSSSDDKQGDEAAATPSKSSEKSEHGKHSKKKSKAEKGEKSDKGAKGNPLGSFRKSKKSKADGGSQTPGEQAEKGAGGGAASGADHPEKHEKDKKKGFFKNLFK